MIYDPQRHKAIPPNDFVKYIQREFNAPDIGAVWDSRTDNWILVEWVHGFRQGQMTELMVLGETPVGSRDMVVSLETMVRGSDAYHRIRGENRDILMNFHRRQDLKDEDELGDERDAYAGWMRRPGRGHSKLTPVG